MTPQPAGELLYRICPSCDLEVRDPSVGSACHVCGTKLVEIRAERDTLIGAVIDERYEIRDKLGQGGMGTVYRAWQRSIGREIAIKLMDHSYSREPMSVRRFLREARLASQLSQPNTVSVFDFGQAADGRLYIAMELIRGRTLHKVVSSEGVFSVERAVRIGVQICDALEAAHTLGIIHRDLKLENIIVLDHPPGRDLLKVLDFGLAKNVKDPASGTESGIVVGTPRYMAPEAATTGESVPAGDLYALGVILAELTLGKDLWQGENLPHLVQQKMDPSAAIRQVPPQLRSIVESLLDPEPTRRPTAEQTRVRLTAALDGEPTADETMRDESPATTVPMRSQPRAEAATIGPRRVAPAESRVEEPARRSRVPIAIGLAALTIAGGVGAFFALRTREPAAVTHDAAPPAPAAVVAIDAAPAIAPEPPVAMVHLSFKVKPATAKLTIDGKPASFEVDLPKTTTPVLVRVEAAGYRPYAARVSPTKTQDVTIVLKPARGATEEKTPF